MPNQTVASLTSLQLRKALKLREEIERLESELNSVFGSTDGMTRRGRPPGRTISAAGRRRIAAAQKARWAKAKPGASALRKGTRRKMSAAARAKIAAAAKKRWAKAKASGKTSLAA